MVGFVLFIVAHVTLVVLTGFRRNMNHIVLGVDNTTPNGMVLGLIGLALLVLSWVVAHYASWYFPRGLQHVSKMLTEPVKLLTLDRLSRGSAIRRIRSLLISGPMASSRCATIGSNWRPGISKTTG